MFTNNGNSLEILVRNRPITEFFHNGSYYVEGRKNSEYVIRYRNNSNLRKKVVISVDGLNVVSGDINWHMGYVVEPWAVLDLPGWRKDNNNVAKFKFSSVGKSYNQHNEMGDAANIGVIGVRVHHEEPKYGTYYQTTNVRYEPDMYREALGAAPMIATMNATGTTDANWMNLAGQNVNYSGDRTRSTKMSRQSKISRNRVPDPVVEQSLGTKWGGNAEFRTTEANLRFLATVMDTLLIYYDSRDGLERRGINLHRKVYAKPEAFPTYTGVACPPPK